MSLLELSTVGVRAESHVSEPNKNVECTRRPDLLVELETSYVTPLGGLSHLKPR